MNSLFRGLISNADLSSWDVSGVRIMRYMFRSSTFNGDISCWNVSGVPSMEWMFSSSTFNGNISSWDVSGVRDMQYMFRSSDFAQELCWDITSGTNTGYMFLNGDGCIYKDCCDNYYNTITCTTVSPLISPSVTPSVRPSVEYSATPSKNPSTCLLLSVKTNVVPTILCAANEKPFIQFMTDAGSKWQNTIVIRTQKKWGWKKILKLNNFSQCELYRHSMCLDKKSCTKFILKDKKKNGLREGSYYELYWGGEKVNNDPIPISIKKQIVEFGDCS